RTPWSWPERLPCPRARRSWNTDAVRCWREVVSRSNFVRLQVRLQCGRNRDASVALLMCLDQRHEQPRQRGAASVQDVRKAVLALFRLDAQIHSTRLEIFAVRAAR